MSTPNAQNACGTDGTSQSGGPGKPGSATVPPTSFLLESEPVGGDAREVPSQRTPRAGFQPASPPAPSGTG